jgi:penicillin-binding protein activator
MKFKTLVIFGLLLTLAGCSSFKAERVDSKESDEMALKITDKWVQRDTETVVKDILKTLETHKGFRRYLMKLGTAPKVFIGEIKNLTSEAYFPIHDLNDELLNDFSATGDFILIDAAARENILKEITYQHDGMVDPRTIKKVGKQTGADLMIFGNVYMRPETREGKTIKQYSINIRMTDIEKGVEVLRARSKVSKYSEQKGSGW